MRRLALLVAIAGCLAARARIAEAQLPTEGPVKPREIRKVYGDGKHNAFTALRRFQGASYLAFRHATTHNTLDGDVVVLRSEDNRDWKEVLRLNVLPDDRDPQFLVAGKRLILYDPALKGADLTTFATFTEDGKTWSEPRAVYEPRFIVWKPTQHNGKYWSAAHKKDESSSGKGREVHLITSNDGLDWKKVSTIRAGNWESETTLHFQGDQAVGFLRQKYGSPPAQIMTSDPPYQEWKARPAPINHFSGHSCHTFRGVTYFFTRTMDYGKRQAGQAIYTYEPDGSLQLYCVLPAGGDCAYAEAIEDGDDMLVSYYSGHETDNPSDHTNIYLAVVPLKK